MTFEYYKNRGTKAFDDIIGKCVDDYETNNTEDARYKVLWRLGLLTIENCLNTLLPSILQGFGITKFGSFKENGYTSITVLFSDKPKKFMAIVFDTHFLREKIIRLLHPEKYHIQARIFASKTTSIRDMINAKCYNNIMTYWMLNNIVVLHLLPDLLWTLVGLVVFDLEWNGSL